MRAASPDIGAIENIPISCSIDSDCNDWLFCNWVEKCLSWICSSWVVPSPPDDWIMCTSSICNEETKSFKTILDNSICDDGDNTTTDICSATLWCKNIPWEWHPDYITTEINITADTAISKNTYEWFWGYIELPFRDGFFYKFDNSSTLF